MQTKNFSSRDLRMAEGLAMWAASEVAPTLRDNFGNTQYTTKTSETDMVTPWDVWAEEEIIKNLSVFSKNVGIISEESGQSGDKDVYWTIDAIDGTGPFVLGIKACTTMISLVDEDRPVVSVINDFMRNISYTAIEGEGAYMNSVQRLRVSQLAMNGARVETYVPTGTKSGDYINERIHQLGGFIIQSSAAGHMFTSIAKGAAEGFVGYLNPYATIWDYAPGALLVKEAGGLVHNIGTEEYSVRNADMIASNPVINAALREIVSEA